MQKTFIGILLTTTLALATLCVVQSRHLRAAHERIRLADEARRVEAGAREMFGTQKSASPAPAR